MAYEQLAAQHRNDLPVLDDVDAPYPVAAGHLVEVAKEL